MKLILGEKMDGDFRSVKENEKYTFKENGQWKKTVSQFWRKTKPPYYEYRPLSDEPINRILYVYP